jgi:hypothetical protein
MKTDSAEVEELFTIADSFQSDGATECINHVLDANYNLSDLQMIDSDSIYLTIKEQQVIHVNPNKHKFLLDGSLVTLTKCIMQNSTKSRYNTLPCTRFSNILSS